MIEYPIHIRSKEKVQLSKTNRIGHFRIAIGLFLYYLSLWLHPLYGKFRDSVPDWYHLLALGIGIVPPIIMYLLRNNALYFQQINTSITNEDFERAILATADELDWDDINFITETHCIVLRFGDILIGGG